MARTQATHPPPPPTAPNEKFTFVEILLYSNSVSNCDQKFSKASKDGYKNVLDIYKKMSYVQILVDIQAYILANQCKTLSRGLSGNWTTADMKIASN